MKGGTNPGKEAIEGLRAWMYRLGAPRLIWDRARGIYIRRLHGEIGTKREKK